MARCQGITKAGARCKRTAAEGEDFCSIHAPANADEAAPPEPDTASAQGATSAPESEVGTERQDEEAGKGTEDAHDAPGDGRGRWKTGSKHIQSGEDLFHMAIGVALGLTLIWLLRRGPKLPGL